MTRALRRVLWPLLRTHGFETFSTRTAWRSRSDTIDVVNVQALVGTSGSRLFLNPGHASFGSFAVNIGTFYTVERLLPWERPYGAPTSGERPKEYECHAREHVTWSRGTARQPHDDVWSVDEDGRDAEDQVRDAAAAIEATALPWFTARHDLAAALEPLAVQCLARARYPDVRPPDAFFRVEDLMAGLAVRVGRIDLAIELFETLAARPFDPDGTRKADSAHAALVRRFERSKRFRDAPRPLAVPRLLYWHDGAVMRLAALRELAASGAPVSRAT